MKEEDAMYCIGFHREKIPYSNIEKMVIEIETGHLPDEFVYDVGKLIVKYERKRLKTSKK
jgi:hypothetical protein